MDEDIPVEVEIERLWNMLWRLQRDIILISKCMGEIRELLDKKDKEKC